MNKGLVIGSSPMGPRIYRGTMSIDIPYQVIGWEEQPAKEHIRSLGLHCRVVKRDGTPLIVTSDFNGNRINLSVDKGVVIEARRG